MVTLLKSSKNRDIWSVGGNDHLPLPGMKTMAKDHANRSNCSSIRKNYVKYDPCHIFFALAR